jgi:hypothetical protein
MTAPRRDDPRKRGFTLIETVISTAFVVLVLGGFALLMRSTGEPNDMMQTIGHLQEAGRRIIRTIGNDLKCVGIRESAGGNLPAIFERPVGPEGTPRGKLVASMSFADANNAQYQWARSGDQSRIERNRDRACNELVFRPIDFEYIDGGGNVRQGWPFDILNGDALKWDGDTVNYRVVRDATGTNWVERRVNDAAPRKIGSFVQNITFDCLASDRTLLYNQVAIVVYLSRTLPNGRVMNAAVEGIVSLGVEREP